MKTRIKAARIAQASSNRHRTQPEPPSASPEEQAHPEQEQARQAGAAYQERLGQADVSTARSGAKPDGKLDALKARFHSAAQASARAARNFVAIATLTAAASTAFAADGPGDGPGGPSAESGGGAVAMEVSTSGGANDATADPETALEAMYGSAGEVDFSASDPGEELRSVAAGMDHPFEVETIETLGGEDRVTMVFNDIESLMEVVQPENLEQLPEGLQKVLSPYGKSVEYQYQMMDGEVNAAEFAYATQTEEGVGEQVYGAMVTPEEGYTEVEGVPFIDGLVEQGWSNEEIKNLVEAHEKGHIAHSSEFDSAIQAVMNDKAFLHQAGLGERGIDIATGQDKEFATFVWEIFADAAAVAETSHSPEEAKEKIDLLMELRGQGDVGHAGIAKVGESLKAVFDDHNPANSVQAVFGLGNDPEAEKRETIEKVETWIRENMETEIVSGYIDDSLAKHPGAGWESDPDNRTSLASNANP